MKLSICSITYNQAPYVREALDSFFSQDVDFDFEVVIGDDASSDGTREILLEYKTRYPDKIKLILHEKNVGMINNFITTIGSCRGQYIALCEGDDFWTDNKKLSKQVGFLDQHPDFAICFHRCKVVFSGMEPIAFPDYNEHTPSVTGIEDLIKGNYIHTPTVLFRNHLFDEYPAAFMKLKIGDWPLHLLNATKGKIYFMDDEMAAYRVSSQGFWSVRNQLNKIEYAIRFLTAVQPYFEKKYEAAFRASVGNYARYLLKLYWRNREYSKLFSEGPSLLIKSIWN